MLSGNSFGILMRRARCAAGSIGVCTALAGCSVAPAYHAPQPPQVSGYTAGSPVTAIDRAAAAQGPTAGAQALRPGLAVDPHWWKSFESPRLTKLVDQALAHNPDLAAAEATLEQAQFSLQAAQGAFGPQVTANAGAKRTRSSGAANGPSTPAQLFNVYTGQVSVSYDPDVFGLNRQIVRAGAAQVDLARDQLAAAHLAIAGNVVGTIFHLAALAEQIAATRQNLADQQQILDLMQTRYRLGAIAQFDVFTQQSQLASTEAALVQLEQARDQARHLIATYLGEFPVGFDHAAVPALASFRLPAELPLSLPSTLVRARPDVRAAEAQLRVANAQVGAAVARLYPDFRLGADFGGQTEHLSTLFDPASRIWDLAFNLAAPIFEGGTLRARKSAAEAAYRGVFARYQKTVLEAFRQVADVLRALQHDARALDAEARAAQDAREALALVRVQYRAGAVDFLSLLTSETQVQNARIALAHAQAQRLADTAALYTALGGGEWGAAQVKRGTARVAGSLQEGN